MKNRLTVADIREVKRALAAFEIFANNTRKIKRVLLRGDSVQKWGWVLSDIVAEDLRCREVVEEHQRDYRERHTATIALEISAFEEWRDSPTIERESWTEFHTRWESALNKLLSKPE